MDCLGHKRVLHFHDIVWDTIFFRKVLDFFNNSHLSYNVHSTTTKIKLSSRKCQSQSQTPSDLREIQLPIFRNMKGLKKLKSSHPGWNIEYNFVNALVLIHPLKPNPFQGSTLYDKFAEQPNSEKLETMENCQIQWWQISQYSF